MKAKLPLKICDPIIIALALSITGFSAYAIYAVPQDTVRVLIEGRGRSWTYPLGAVETITVGGPLGSTIVRIQDNQAWVESSPCDNQVCVTAGRLSRNMDFAACLPNQVLVIVEGTGNINEVDTTSR